MTLMPRACLKPSQSTIPCSDRGIAVPGQSRCRNHMYKHGWGKYALKHPDRAAFYASPHWRERRAAHLLANPDCVVCGQPATAADHITNLASGGSFGGPLQSLCTEHHRRKTQAESKLGIKRAAARRKEQGK